MGGSASVMMASQPYSNWGIVIYLLSTWSEATQECIYTITYIYVSIFFLSLDLSVAVAMRLYLSGCLYIYI